jgi:hypothetical protein
MPKSELKYMEDPIDVGHKTLKNTLLAQNIVSTGVFCAQRGWRKTVEHTFYYADIER